MAFEKAQILNILADGREKKRNHCHYHVASTGVYEHFEAVSIYRI